MSVYSQYATGASFDVAVDESYDGLVGIYRMIEESARNEHAIFEHVIACDFAEAYVENGAMNESSLEAINEASLGEIWEKVKEFVKKMWEKILGIIQNLLVKIQSVFIRDGKELVRKYDKRILERMNTNKLSKMPVKYHRENKSSKAGISDSASLLKEDIITAVAVSKLGDAWDRECGLVMKADNFNAKKSDGDKDWKDVTDKVKDRDEVKPYTSDDIEDMKDDALSTLLGSSTDTKSFTKDLMDDVFEEYDEEGFTTEDYRFCKTTLEGFKKALNTIKKQETLAKKEYKEDMRKIEQIQKKFGKDLTKEHYKSSAALARAYASRAIQINNARNAVIGTMFAGITSVTKKMFAEARSLWIKAASYGGKAESTFLEAVQEVSDWEVEEMFEMN